MTVPLWDQLLDQAEELLADGDPSEADRRRAVSDAYYAVFHRVTQAVVRNVAGGASAPAIDEVRRTFGHRAVAEACRWITRGGAKPNKRGASELAASIKTGSQDLVSVASTFPNLQERRERADYDHASAPTMLEARTAIDDADEAIDALEASIGTPEFDSFALLMMVFGR